MNKKLVALAAVFLLYGCSNMPGFLGGRPARTVDGVLVDPANGMTLYTFDKDSVGKSTCVGGCATNWPPFKAPADAKAEGDYTVVTREDGSKQWAYKGRPLYLWMKDQKPGDRTGDAFNNVWRVARP